ncbi:MAG TPA: valine--tRNA ligase, partial [Candidatus Eremiobacteraeota bacterium]|nr:valine--tRNA ligase [Candidatus Eremiobacteraeota bacterium]
MELSKVYEPHDIEKKWYHQWMESESFKVKVNEKNPFTIIIPPPNVTGSLHIGHALDTTIQDMIIRFRRMEGYNTLWIPGTDHAGIATQNVVEKELAREGLSRKDLGREEFLKRVWAWKEQYGRNIVYQLQRLGVTCDWNRERFTMDEVCSKAVRTAFKSLFDKGLIYRGKYMINWCPRCLTAISDLEVHHVETEGNLYYIQYPFVDSEGGIIVATTRPETMLGDTAVAIHPEDEKYTAFIGKTLFLPLLNRKIPVIPDEYVDPSFGTGAVKITPAHDMNDFLVGERHNLPRVVAIGEEGIMTDEAGPYKGLTREECRKKIIEDLKSQGYLINILPYVHSVGRCARCDTFVEPFISEQWFCKMEELAKPAIEAVRTGQTRFFPEKFKDLYLYWMENIKDWCISRQLWWGHRIPVWYCRECGNTFSSVEEPLKCLKCSGSKIDQDSDVLDTWFSSALWPLSTMGWPDESEDIKYFYPTSVLVTARDIIYLWVARMMMMGLEFKKDVPFRHVFIHATILNAEGRRMSKSLGTGVDPLDLMDKYGTDATRFGLTFMTAQGQDVRFTEERLEMSRNFANKIWNATRFVLLHLSDFTSGNNILIADLELDTPSRWIISRYMSIITRVTYAYANYEFSDAAREIYEFFWNEFCDWYLEISKLSLIENNKIRFNIQYVLWYVLSGTLKLLHPIMPFITQELWSHLPSCNGIIMFSDWPYSNENMIDENIEKEMDTFMGLVKTIRALRGEISLAPSKEIQICIVGSEQKDMDLIEKYRFYITKLAKVNDLKWGLKLENKPEQSMSQCFQSMVLYMPVKDLIDVDQEKEKLHKEIDKLEKDFLKLQNKLSNEDFLEKAPKDIIDRDTTRRDEISF